MMLALEKVGSSFTGWIRSCFVCVVPGDGSQPNRQAGISGVEREMKVCHTQPHLVPPMKLVVYDDLPSPSIHQHRNSLSSWLNDGRHLASRASNRASISLKRTSTTPLKIGAPSDFRRVQSFHDHPSQSFHCPPAPTYQPLDLRIHRAGNRLSDLPSFETFQLYEGPQRETPAVPPRALTTSTNIRDRHYQKPSVISRKPVGSQKRRSLGNLEHLVIEEPVRITSSFLSHSSKVSPIKTCVPGAQETSPIHGRSKSEGHQLTLNTAWPLDANTSQPWEKDPQTPLASRNLNTESPDTSTSKYSGSSTESPSSASSHTIPSQCSLLQFPSVPVSENRGRIDSVSSSPFDSVSQWMLPTSTKPFLPASNDFNWERTRTLSGTTVGSNTTTIAGGTRARNNDSISSAFSTAITPRTSLQVASPAPEKYLDAGVCYPTIFEGQQQHHNLPAYHDTRQIRYHDTGIGLAF
ncbi:hypothetical protein N7475_005374 [Penicillium sp. IBT 31633x]|nr:hypothetical protein N7475_005374 [Penicillium sp. IBT 31633x]